MSQTPTCIKYLLVIDAENRGEFVRNELQKGMAELYGHVDQNTLE